MKTIPSDIMMLAAIIIFAASCVARMCSGSNEGVVIGLLITIILLEFRKEMK
jgi:hypothetical protein